MRVVFVGEAPRRADVPAFWPFSPGSGRRLAELLGMTPKELWARRRGDFTFVNLFGEPVEKWDVALARMKAIFVCDEYFAFRPVVAVLLGRRVAEAMVHPWPFFHINSLDGGGWSVSVPHPSGRCRVWNDEGNVEKFRKTMRELRVINTINAGGD